MRPQIKRVALVSTLGALVAGSVWAGTAAKAKPAGGPAKPAAAVPATTEGRKLIVYYFHEAARCRTCLKFETVTTDVLETRFAQELKDRTLEWRVVNLEEGDNGRFIQAYGLFTKSIVLSLTADGKETRWKNLDQIWEKVRKEPDFRAYIEKEIRAFLAVPA